jgi:peptidoglycan/xylan/chitin deacetylase (PgdA/CDA1 family)
MNEVQPFPLWQGANMTATRYATSWKEGASRPKGAKGRVRSLLRHAALTALSRIRSGEGDTFLRALYCHSVFDDQRERFERLIVELQRMGTFITTDRCLDMHEGKRAIDGRYFHLSFDDGFRNLFTNAVPILQRHHVPALVLVPSSLVGAGWRRAQTYCLETMGYSGVIELIRWGDLAEMVSAGFEVGSHTRTHPRLAALSAQPAVLEDEFLGSKREIEDRLGRECKYLAWPYGTTCDITEVALQAVAQARYRGCFSAIRGSVRQPDGNRYSIPRHHFEVEWPLSHVRFYARGHMEGQTSCPLFWRVSSAIDNRGAAQLPAGFDIAPGYVSNNQSLVEQVGDAHSDEAAASTAFLPPSSRT